MLFNKFTKILIFIEVKCINIRIINGNKYDYIGMDIASSTLGEVKITMVPYLNKVIKYLPEEIRGQSTRLNSYHLLKMRDEGTM